MWCCFIIQGMSSNYKQTKQGREKQWILTMMVIVIWLIKYENYIYIYELGIDKYELKWKLLSNNNIWIHWNLCKFWSLSSGCLVDNVGDCEILHVTEAPHFQNAHGPLPPHYQLLNPSNVTNMPSAQQFVPPPFRATGANTVHQNNHCSLPLSQPSGNTFQQSSQQQCPLVCKVRVPIRSSQINFWVESDQILTNFQSEIHVVRFWSDSNHKQGRLNGRLNESHDYCHHLSFAICSVCWVDHVTSHVDQLCNHTHHFPTFPPSTPSHHSPPITHSHPLAPTTHSHEDHQAKGITKNGGTITTFINIMSTGKKKNPVFLILTSILQDNDHWRCCSIFYLLSAITTAINTVSAGVRGHLWAPPSPMEYVHLTTLDKLRLADTLYIPPHRQQPHHSSLIVSLSRPPLTN